MRWTLPNMITLARICLTPVIALLPFIEGYWPKVIAFIIFLIAAFSDILDGWLARRYNTVSDLGKLLDPIADKLLLFATLIPIFWMTPWWITASSGGGACRCGWPCCSSAARS